MFIYWVTAYASYMKKFRVFLCSKNTFSPLGKNGSDITPVENAYFSLKDQGSAPLIQSLRLSNNLPLRGKIRAFQRQEGKDQDPGY